MKFAVKIVLLIFITFLATPTIVSLIKNSCDTTIFYSMSEEEQIHKEVKEIKAEFKVNNFDFVSIAQFTSTPIVTENLLKHDNVSTSIFSPPPNI